MSAVSQPQRLRSPSLPTWWQELRPGVVLAGLVVTFFILAVVAPSLLAGGQSPLAINLAETLRAPSLDHIFGTDASGRDLYARVIYGARESLLIGSQNASVTSLTRNRELGILLNREHGGGGAIATASATFDSDFRDAFPRSSPRSKAKPKPTPAPKPTTCHPRTSSGNCYEPGEYCSDADHGVTGIAGDGEAIVCENNDGWRWEPV